MTGNQTWYSKVASFQRIYKYMLEAKAIHQYKSGVDIDLSLL